MKISLSLLVLVIFLSGCLKNKIEYDYSGIKPVIINPNSNYPPKGALATPITDSAFGIKTIRLYAKYSYQAPTGKDVTVTIATNDSLVTAFNQLQFIKYQPLPANAYSLPATQIVIKAGTFQGFIPITVFPDKFNGTSNYAIAFTIKDGGGTAVADNYKSIVFTLKGH